MAATAQLVFENFIWRIESKTPTDTSVLTEGFLYSSGYKVPEETRPRSFSVLWNSSGEDAMAGGDPIVEDLSGRIADHQYTVEVYYRAEFGDRDLQKVILLDRHDIAKQLRDPALFVGYDDDNSSASLGVCDRKRVSDEIERGEVVWTYRSVWALIISEDE